MEHMGSLQFEDQPEERRSDGSIEFISDKVIIRVQGTVVSEVPAQGLFIEPWPDGKYRLKIEGSGLLFTPGDRESMQRELQAHEFRTRLAPIQQTTLPAVPSTPPTLQKAAVVTGPAKNPGVAAVLSFLWPGLGQIYNGQIGKGMVFLVVQAVNALLTFVLIGFFTGFIVWIWAMVDAYKEAENYNRLIGG